MGSPNIPQKGEILGRKKANDVETGERSNRIGCDCKKRRPDKKGRKGSVLKGEKRSRPSNKWHQTLEGYFWVLPGYKKRGGKDHVERKK